MRRICFAILFVPGLPIPSAFAAGYGLHEESADSMGTAYAGAAVGGQDASYISYNPAAAGATDNGDFSVSAVSIMPSTSARYTTALTAAGTPTGGNANPRGFVRNALIPDIAMRQRLDRRWSVGLALSVPWGVDTDYPATWAGRYYGLQTKLTAINLSPVVAYDLTPNIIVAGGLQAQYAKGTLSSAVDIGTLGLLNQIPGSVPGKMDGFSTVNAHSWAYGFVLGARAALDDGWTLGVSYRSAVHHTLKGPWTFTLDQAGLGAAIRGATGVLSDTTMRTKLTTPDVVALGLQKMLGDRWTALAEIEWTNWTTFDALNVMAANPSQPSDITNTQWKQAWMVALGAEYSVDERLKLRGGIAYDGTPVPSGTIDSRIPDGSRDWIAVGATYQATEAIDLKLSASHLFVGTRPIAQTAAMTGNALRGTLAGTTESSANLAAAQLAYHW